MKIFVGLGNPGEKYKNNRHNVGFWSIEHSIDSIESKNISVKIYNKFNSEIIEATINNEKYLFVKPQTFMNNSGIAVKKILNYFKININDLTVIHDDLDIPLGKFKIQKAGGPKLHNGILSIENELKTKDFSRIRIGIDNPSTRSSISLRTRSGQARIDGEKYVLSDFTNEERERINKVFEQVIKILNF